MFKFFENKIAEESLEEAKKKLAVEQAAKFFILGHPEVAKEYFKKTGLKDEEINALIEEAKLLVLENEKKKEERKPPKPVKTELTSVEKIKLKDLGLSCLVINPTAAQIYFKHIGLLDEEARRLMGLNLLEIDQERKKLQEELLKMRQIQQIEKRE